MIRLQQRVVGSLVGVALALAVVIARVEAGYVDEVLADNPILYYQVDEASGSTTADNTGTGGAALDGQYAGFPHPANANAGLGLDGRIGSAVRFRSDDMDGTLRLADMPATSITGALTLEAWINPDLINPANANGIVGKYDGGGNRSYVMVIRTDGRLDGTISPDGDNFESVVSASTIPTGVWTHVAFVYDPGTGAPDDSTMTVFINGVADGTRSDANVPDAIHDSTAVLEVGTFFSNNPTTGFDGLIDEVAVYNTALGSDRILAHYSAAFTPEPASGLMLLMGLSGLLIRRRRRIRD